MHTPPIHVGTASWTDPTLLACKRFYPAGADTPETRLRHYASQFSLVEADASYYALPDPRVAHRWALRTPPGFVINMKAFRLFTGHGASAAALPADIRRELPADSPPKLYYRDLPGTLRRELWARFLEGAEPLRQAGKLGALHFQFAPWVRPDEAGRAHVAHCLDMSEGMVCAVEFRQRDWFAATRGGWTLDFLRERQAAHVVVDSPQGFENTVPAVWETTRDDLAVIRLHGRNAANWNAPASAASSGRFQYEYTEAELAELARRTRDLAARLARGQAHVVLNTNYQDQGIRNARGFVLALSDAGARRPIPLSTR